MVKSVPRSWFNVFGFISKSIKYKILACLVFVILAFVALTLFNYVSYNKNMDMYVQWSNNLVNINKVISLSNTMSDTSKAIKVNPNDQDKINLYNTSKNSITTYMDLIEKNTAVENKRWLTIVLNSTKSFMGDAEHLVEASIKNDQGNMGVYYDSVSKKAAFVKENGGILIQSEIDSSTRISQEIDKQIQLSKMLSIAYAILIIAISLAVILLILRNITKSLGKLVKLSRKISTGDLTKEDLKIKNRDELGTLYEAFLLMQSRLIEILGMVSHSGINIRSTCKVMDEITNENYHIARELVKSAECNAADAEVQSHSVETVQKSIVDVNELISNIFNETQIAMSSAGVALDKAMYVQEKMKEVLIQSESVAQRVRESSQRADELFEYSTQIGKIVNIIGAISAQTNLLALNAAIEAAGDGTGDGKRKGYGVIATEIKKLAIKSKASTLEIRSKVECIQRMIEEMKNGMQESVETITYSTSIVDEEEKAFNEIINTNQSLNTQILQINEMLSVATGKVQNITASSHVINDISQKIAASSEESFASLEQQMAGQDEVKSVQAKLMEISGEFETTISGFKI